MNHNQIMVEVVASRMANLAGAGVLRAERDRRQDRAETAAASVVLPVVPPTPGATAASVPPPAVGGPQQRRASAVSRPLPPPVLTHGSRLRPTGVCGPWPAARGTVLRRNTVPDRCSCAVRRVGRSTRRAHANSSSLLCKSGSRRAQALGSFGARAGRSAACGMRLPLPPHPPARGSPGSARPAPPRPAPCAGAPSAVPWQTAQPPRAARVGPTR